ncbi:hypothetical protein STCU_11024 [Strigomonas culicis]|uniref:Uncharacterized protein n=1 Tax=Strigomonas culicis TaxID=28005 RepID=S9V1R1_9TRYP|nr:hypothetical protein STCU_11024 [Strigomonas culicis]|eukprot:EPY16740.1 hypothetical protein STCU_11024 [Strigomonas culicis]
MGYFSLIVENTVRDVNALLELHRVQAQVRQDVNLLLQHLVRKSYNENYMNIPTDFYVEQEAQEQGAGALPLRRTAPPHRRRAAGARPGRCG